jgi:hypothetical protein
MRSPTCALARLLPITPASEDDLRSMRAAAWHKQGVLVVVLDTVTDSWERKFLEGIGNRIYGRRQPVVGGLHDGR